METNNINNLEKKQIVKTIEDVIESGFNIDTSDDKEFLEKTEYNWDDLNKLKEDLCSHIVQFISQVQEVITNPAIIQNLGDKKEHFNKIIELFFTDINNFSFKIKDIREFHENKSGRITNMNDFNNYNKIAIQYQSLFSELATLITPILADLMMLITEIVPRKENQDCGGENTENRQEVKKVLQ